MCPFSKIQSERFKNLNDSKKNERFDNSERFKKKRRLATLSRVRRLGQKRKTKYGAGRKKESAIRTLRKLSPDDTRKRKRIARGIQADRDNYQETVPLPSRAGPVAKRDYDKKALQDLERFLEEIAIHSLDNFIF